MNNNEFKNRKVLSSQPVKDVEEDSPILAFYSATGEDNKGRSLSDIITRPDDWWERTHDFIQWVFPLNKKSEYNDNSPVLNQSDTDEFRLSVSMQEKLATSFNRFLSFLGLEYKDGVKEGKDWGDKSQLVLKPNHNWLRITRVLKSMTLLGQKQKAVDFVNFLKHLDRVYPRKIAEETLAFWKEAVK